MMPNLPMETDLRKRASPLASAAHWRRYAAKERAPRARAMEVDAVQVRTSNAGMRGLDASDFWAGPSCHDHGSTAPRAASVTTTDPLQMGRRYHLEVREAVMAKKRFEQIEQSHRQFIETQHMFLVATAAPDGRVNTRRGQVFHYHITSDILTAPWLDPYD